MRLFELDDTYTLTFEPELFTIKAFADLRNARKKKAELVFKELSFVYNVCDLRSDLQFQTNLKRREEEAKDMVNLPEKWEPDELVRECMRVYKYLSQTVSSKLLESAYKAVDKLQEHIEKMDLNERTNTGSPVWNPKMISDIVKSIPDLLKSIQMAEAEYLKGQDMNDKLRGEKLKTLYEDGFTRQSDKYSSVS